MSNIDLAEYTKAKEYAFRSLTCHDQTEWELRRKLKMRDYHTDTVDAVIEMLKEYNYVNDQRYTEQYVASHCGKWNRRKLLEHLYAKGIHADDCIDALLEQYQYEEEKVLERAMEKYIKNKNLSDRKNCEKVIVYFMHKGYTYSMIQTMMKERFMVDKEEVIENE